MLRSRAEVLAALVSAAVFAALLIGARSFSLLQPLELVAYDLLVSVRANLSALPMRVAVVAISDADLERGWPVSDSYVADVIDAVEKAGALTIGLDIYRDSPVEPGADRLRQLLRAQSNTIGITKLPSKGTSGVKSHPSLRSYFRSGFADFPVDRDRVVRRALLLASLGQSDTRISFALATVMAAIEARALPVNPENPRSLKLGPTEIPMLSEGAGAYMDLDGGGYQMLIDYRQPLAAIPVVPAADLFRSGARELAGKIVVIGMFSDTVKDNFRVAQVRPDAGVVKGATLHAAIIDQLLRFHHGDSRPTQALPTALVNLLIVSAGLLAAIAAVICTGGAQTIVVGVGGLAIIVALSLITFLGDWWPPVLPTAISWTGGFLLASASISLAVRRQQRALRALFVAHLSPTLATQVWRQRGNLLAGGKPRPVKLFATVMFVDLADSSKATLAIGAAAYMEWIDAFLERMAALVIRHGGLIETFTGDGLMAVFGAPLPSETEGERQRDAAAAADCALAMRNEVAILNNCITDPNRRYRIRVGLHSGTVFGGTIGRPNKLQYVVLGDPANGAARLESFGRKHLAEVNGDCVISISGQVLSLLENRFAVEPAGELKREDGSSILKVYRLVSR